MIEGIEQGGQDHPNRVAALAARGLKHAPEIQHQDMRTPPTARRHQPLCFQLQVRLAHGMQVDRKALCKLAHRRQPVAGLERSLAISQVSCCLSW